MIENKTRQINFDLLRILATLGVICIHVDSAIWHTQLGVENLKWTIANMFDGLSRWAVPVFFMLSGYFILNKEIHIPEFYKTKLPRIILPLLFWSVVYILFNTYLFDLNKNLSVESFIDTIFYKRAAFHMWFVYSLIGLYLIAPFIQGSLRKNKIFGNYFLLIGISIILFQYFVTKLFGIRLRVDTQYFHFPIVYFVLGYQVRNIDFTKTTYVHLKSILAFFASTFLAIYFVYKFSIYSDSDAPFGFFYSNSHPFIIIASFSIFVFFHNWKLSINKTNFSYKLIQNLSKYSYGIYLSHILVRTLIEKEYFGKFLIVSHTDTNPIVYILYRVLLIFVISYLIIFLLDKLTFKKLTKLIT